MMAMKKATKPIHLASASRQARSVVRAIHLSFHRQQCRRRGDRVSNNVKKKFHESAKVEPERSDVTAPCPFPQTWSSSPHPARLYAQPCLPSAAARWYKSGERRNDRHGGSGN